MDLWKYAGLKRFKCGPGGWDCPCCAPPPKERKKRQHKLARMELKRMLRDEIKESNDV